MAEIIIKGTTPTITYTFSSVEVTELTKAVLTIKADGVIKIEKDLTSADVDAQKKTVSWTLSQAETLSVTTKAEVMINWVTQNGTRGASDKTNVLFDRNHIEEVI